VLNIVNDDLLISQSHYVWPTGSERTVCNTRSVHWMAAYVLVLSAAVYFSDTTTWETCRFQILPSDSRVVNETYDAETETRPRLRSDETETRPRHWSDETKTSVPPVRDETETRRSKQRLETFGRDV